MSQHASDDVPPTLRWAVWLLLAETAGIIVLLVFLMIEAVGPTSESVRTAVTLMIFSALMGTLFAFLAVALWRRRRWARGPAIVMQLLLLPIGYSMISSGLVWLGLPIMAISACVAGALLAPATRAALGVH